MNRLRIVKAFAGVIISLASLHSVSGMYANAVLDTITISSSTVVPSTLAEGNSVVIKGTLKSDSKMTTITVAVFDTNGKRVTGKTVYPSAYSYDLSKLDSYVNFHKLDAGRYTFEIIAANADSENNILVNKTFRVTE